MLPADHLSEALKTVILFVVFYRWFDLELV